MILTYKRKSSNSLFFNEDFCFIILTHIKFGHIIQPCIVKSLALAGGEKQVEYIWRLKALLCSTFVAS